MKTIKPGENQVIICLSQSQQFMDTDSRQESVLVTFICRIPDFNTGGRPDIIQRLSIIQFDVGKSKTKCQSIIAYTSALDYEFVNSSSVQQKTSTIALFILTDKCHKWFHLYIISKVTSYTLLH